MAYFGPYKCCSLRIFAFAVGIMFLLVQTTLLITTFVLMRNIETHVADMIDWFITKGVYLPTIRNTPNITSNGTLSDNNFLSYKAYLIQKSGDYLAIPICINVVLIISDTLLIWASASKNKLLLWPWLILHCLEWLFFIAMLILLMYIVPEPWFKVVVFLVGSPIIILLGYFWTVVKLLYNYLRDLSLKSAVAAIYQNGYKKRVPSGQKGPATVYTPQPSNWDHPVPVWAMRPPPSIWDPDYLQQLDPRYQLEQLRPVLPRPLRSQRKPTQVLPDGTIVVPIGSEDEENDGASLSSNKFGSVRSLSDKYQKSSSIGQQPDDGLISHVSSKQTALSEDLSSIISLSDKYRQQEEVEIYHEHFQKPPPEPILPLKQPQTPTSSRSTESTESPADY